MTVPAAPTIPEQLRSLAVPIDSLNAYEANPRRGDLEALRSSLSAHGQYRPVVANVRDRVVLAGNHTLAAARDLGWTELAVTWVDVDDDTARRIVLVDNRTSDLAGYDNDLLTTLLEDLTSLEGTGYDDAALEQLLSDRPRPALTDLDDAPPPVESGAHHLRG